MFKRRYEYNVIRMKPRDRALHTYSGTVKASSDNAAFHQVIGESARKCHAFMGDVWPLVCVTVWRSGPKGCIKNPDFVDSIIEASGFTSKEGE